ncbi:MAG: hypothetical protein KA409_04345 [Ferruginibacter sp.]|nr:hypothetical protein [Chitinophagaceae bacterium]MBP6286127.1 hypothetical protein [Ferruginibacter sp.]
MKNVVSIEGRDAAKRRAAFRSIVSYVLPTPVSMTGIIKNHEGHHRDGVPGRSTRPLHRGRHYSFRK